MARRMALAVMAATTLGLGLAAPAGAGTLTKVINGSDIFYLYTAAAGETNDVTITDDPTNFTIDDSGVASITVNNSPTATGCGSVDANTKTCPISGIDFVRVVAGNMNDAVSADGTTAKMEFFGEAGADDLDGSLGPDLLDGGADNDTNLFGDAGNDTIKPGEGANTSNGSTDIDTLSYDDPAVGAVTVDLSANTGDDGEPASGFENVIGGASTDNITGTTGPNRLEGLGGTDTLLGGDGDDVLVGGLGADTLTDGLGTDTLSWDDGRVTGFTLNLTGTGGSTTPDGDTLTEAAERYLGSDQNDIMNGGTLADTLDGNNGDDFIDGNANNDIIDGGNDDDTLIGDAGADTLTDGLGTDTLSWDDGRVAGIVLTLTTAGTTTGAVTPDNDVITEAAELYVGSDQNDTMNGSQNADKFNGGPGLDTLDGNDGSDILIGGSAKDAIIGDLGTADVASYEERSSNPQLNLELGTNADDDTFTGVEKWLGGTGVDTMTGRNGTADNFDGNTGDDTLKGGTGPGDTLTGGDGNDTVSYDDGRATGVNVDLTLAAGPEGDVLATLEHAIGGDADDRLLGGSGGNILTGGGGNDTLVGRGGIDTLAGGAGTADVASYEDRNTAVTVSLAGGAKPDGDGYTGIEGLAGGSAADVLTGDGAANVLNGGGGADRLIGAGGADFLNGSTPGASGDADAASDVASYEERATPVVAQIGAAAPDGDILNDIQGLAGGSADDILTGDGGPNTLIGYGGADTLLGAGGADALLGGPADGSSDGVTDTVSYDDGRGAGITLDLGAGTNGDSDTFADIQAFLGSDEGDTMTGGPGADSFNGGLGNDALTGGDGDDALTGGSGNDTLTGLGGIDAFDAGTGDDFVKALDGLADTGTCGEGIDRPELDAVDSILDCEPEIPPPPPPPPPVDFDKDGFIASQDCNDSDAKIRPGAVEILGNAVDENCDGIKSPFPNLDVGVGNQFAFSRTSTQIKVLEVRRAPSGAKVKITCKSKKKKNKGCPFKTKTLTSKGKTVKLVSLFKKRKLPVGTVVEVTTTTADTIGKVVRYTMRKSKTPKVEALCLPPGGKVGKC